MGSFALKYQRADWRGGGGEEEEKKAVLKEGWCLIRKVFQQVGVQLYSQR